ncbi:heavy metal translocating P-type ATPase [Acinetobacter sp. MD2]|uniref:heavy metal translocating P-type ATPase n=1 Tax=Acinetobacter sp. MD2 TaxID=2600066 RepID=UPI002D1F271B|nr:heavy metal translocating P-type ATPase [Acinetobacter sp. MD2]MEB3767537.1 copper-translocating P-type ATPase [Acinetobacter sp. MD2]
MYPSAQDHTQNLNITGMTCASCVGRVERALKKVQGVIDVSVNLATEQAQIKSEITIQAQQLIDAVTKAGFDAHVPEHSVELDIQGMSCASCVGRVEKALTQVNGVLAVSINLATEKAQLRLTDDVIDGQLIQAVQKAGFAANVVQAQQLNAVDELTQRREQDAQSLQRDFYIALVLTLPVFILEMGGHLIPTWHHWIAHTLGTSTSQWIQFICTTLVLLFPARRFYQKGVPALLRFAPDMNSLVTLGTLAAYSFSCVAMFLPNLLPLNNQHVYFESAAMIVTLILLGRYFEAKAKGRTSAAIQHLLGLQPKTAKIIQNAEVLTVDISQVKVGMRVLIQPGEKIPVDGQVIDGNSFVDESMMSGEPLAVAKKTGDIAIAGTINQQGTLTVQTTAVGTDTVLAQIVRLVEQAQTSKLPIQSLVDKVTMWFVPVVMALALLTFIVWWLYGPQPALSLALVNAVAVLIIACPCAMGLATPTSIMVGTGRGAELGILFKQGDALQHLQQAKVVAFDKTGTLTEGKPSLTELDVLAPFDQTQILIWAASIEQKSEHPIGTAVVEYAQVQQIALLEVEQFHALTGYGVQAVVDGHQIHLGAARLMQQLGLSLSVFDEKMQQAANAGQTPIYMAVDGQLAAMLIVADAIKTTTASAIQYLHQLGLKIVMITGDHHLTAQAIAKQLDIDEVVAEVLPAQKAKTIQKLQQHYGTLAFVGDGINDAPALAAADIGIAVGTGTDIAIESADVVLMSGNLQGVGHAIALSKATILNIKQNLFWAFVYNAALIPVAAGALYPAYGILLSPMFAAFAMAMSSVFVLGNALRLKRFNAVFSQG